MINLTNFQRPQRYVGNEWNVIKKPHQGKIKICLAYPDLYEIGMSNLGLRIIYGLLNEYPDIVCERSFLPGSDLIIHLSQSQDKLFSLESKTPLSEFEVIGVNIGHELNYTNFLKILDLGGIPIYANQRADNIVVVSSVSNPEPLADFVDVFYIGEFEENSKIFVDILKNCKSKPERLRALAGQEGFYVPSMYNFYRKANTYFFEKKYPDVSLPIKRAYVRDLDTSYVPTKWLTPHTEITHDRVPIELARGCPRRCTFCQARDVYFPYRQRKVETVKRLVRQIYETSGYEEFSFLALSASDYSHIEALLDEMYPFFLKHQIGLSLPSLRVDDLITVLHKKLLKLKKSSLTLAVEAARDPLRNRLNKEIDIKKLFEAAKVIKHLGTRRIKIYFMFGLPGEEEEDLLAMRDFVNKLRSESGLMVGVSINIFIPKPFSIWSDQKMETESNLNRKRQSILNNFSRVRNIKLSVASVKNILLEAIISRADRKFSEVIYKAYSKGAIMDGYSEHFNWQIWEEAMADSDIDYNDYLNNTSDNYPWSFIESAKVINSCK